MDNYCDDIDLKPELMKLINGKSKFKNKYQVILIQNGNIREIIDTNTFISLFLDDSFPEFRRGGELKDCCFLRNALDYYILNMFAEYVDFR